ncbi:hypothetical protein ACDY96_24035 [Rhizobium mongolense]|uniref:hypothetical protein n=1 Tax=Rhizobium mongolense TaxID=57676 RepID=UPI003556C544
MTRLIIGLIEAFDVLHDGEAEPDQIRRYLVLEDEARMNLETSAAAKVQVFETVEKAEEVNVALRPDVSQGRKIGFRELMKLPTFAAPQLLIVDRGRIPRCTPSHRLNQSVNPRNYFGALSLQCRHSDEMSRGCDGSLGSFL